MPTLDSSPARYAPMYSVPSMHSSVSMLVDENWYAMLRAASLDIAMLCLISDISI